MTICFLCGEDNPPSEAICRRCRSTLALDRGRPDESLELPASALADPPRPLPEPEPAAPPRPASPAAPPPADEVDGPPARKTSSIVSLPAPMPRPAEEVQARKTSSIVPLPAPVPRPVEEAQARKISSVVPLPVPAPLPGPAGGRGGSSAPPGLPEGPAGPSAEDLGLSLPVLAKRPDAPTSAARPSASPAPAASGRSEERSEAGEGAERLVEAPAHEDGAPPDIDLDALDGEVFARAEARERVAFRERRRSGMKQLERPAPRPADPRLVIGAPPLPEAPRLPPLVQALRPASPGPLARVRYALASPRVIGAQREALGELGRLLARARRHEAAALASLGRGARLHGLAPAEAADLAEAADAEGVGVVASEAAAAARRDEEQQAADELHAVRRRAEARLAEIEEEHAPLAARRAELARRLEGSEALLAELRDHAEELRRKAESEPTVEEVGGAIEARGDRILVTPKSLEEEVARRKREHRAAEAERRSLEKTVASLRSGAEALAEPIARAEAEMERLRAEVRAAAHRAEGAEADAEAAVRARRRRLAYANRSAAELDEEIGRMIVERRGRHTPALATLESTVDRCRSRIAEVEEALNAQQDELDLHEPGRAGSGAWILLAASFAAALLLVAAGELLRRFLLTIEG